MTNKSMFAMYILGKTESGNKWNSVNYNDPITIGMMQWYGTRAAALLGLLSAGWGTLEPSIKASLDAHPATDGWWTSRYLTKAEGNSVAALIDTPDGHTAQQTTWDSDYVGNVGVLAAYGFSEDRPQPLIMIMSALHQSPKRARNIANTIGGDSNLLRVFQAIMAEPVLGQYKSRYQQTYDALAAWDGVSAPPDFGATDPGDPNPGGSPVISAGGPTPDPNLTGDIRLIQQNGDQLMVTNGDGRRSILYPNSIQTWAGNTVAPAPVVTETTPPPPPVEPPPVGTSNAQAVVDYGMTLLNAFGYSQGSGRLDPLNSGVTDCSGFTRLCYMHVLGIDPGTATIFQVDTGTRIYAGSGDSVNASIIANWLPGDLIVIDWDGGRTDHVEMYIGGNQTLSHGGPGKGPDIVTNAINECHAANRVWINRYA